MLGLFCLQVCFQNKQKKSYGEEENRNLLNDIKHQTAFFLSWHKTNIRNGEAEKLFAQKLFEHFILSLKSWCLAATHFETVGSGRLFRSSHMLKENTWQSILQLIRLIGNRLVTWSRIKSISERLSRSNIKMDRSSLFCERPHWQTGQQLIIMSYVKL